ncbi:MAG: heat-inducible transcriptional repressor [Pseudomonadota bacterium]
MTRGLESGINERAQHFLKVLIERYIRDGQPVGSRTLARDAGMDLSPATVRNVMADLEELGFVASPHTSAGRVPTVSGYRFFVDSLISLKPLDESEVRRAKVELGSDGNPTKLLESASKLLSNLTHLAGVVMVPRRDHVTVKQVEFIQLSNTRVLTVLVTSNGEVLNRIIETARRFTPSELEQAGNYLTRHYGGRDLEGMRAELLREMEEARRSMNTLMAKVLEMADAAITRDGRADYVMAGQTNLMDFDELAQMDRLRQLFDAFAEKQEILHLLDRSLHGAGMQVFIGEESGHNLLESCSVITAPYQVDHEVVGVLGVIGPTRMAYDRVIPIVDVTARLLGAALKTR